MGHEIIKGDFEWENGLKDTRVEWKSSEKGRFSIKVWKPNLIQRILIKLKIIKDRRYNGSKKDFYLMDECGHWQDPKWENIYSWRPKK